MRTDTNSPRMHQPAPAEPLIASAHGANGPVNLKLAYIHACISYYVHQLQQRAVAGAAANIEEGMVAWAQCYPGDSPRGAPRAATYACCGPRTCTAEHCVLKYQCAAMVDLLRHCARIRILPGPPRNRCRACGSGARAPISARGRTSPRPQNRGPHRSSKAGARGRGRGHWARSPWAHGECPMCPTQRGTAHD